MDFFSSLKGDKDKDERKEKSKPTSDDYDDDDRDDNYADPEKKKPSKSELFKSAKVVADAINGPPEKRDKAKVAGAAANLLGAAGDYGLDDKGYGKYLDKAEDMLRKQAGKGSTTADGTDGVKTSNKKSGGGYGEVLKMAKGFLGDKKKSRGLDDEDEEEEEVDEDGNPTGRRRSRDEDEEEEKGEEYYHHEEEGEEEHSPRERGRRHEEDDE